MLVLGSLVPLAFEEPDGIREPVNLVLPSDLTAADLQEIVAAASAINVDYMHAIFL
jgi:hypothetical protein